MIAIGRPEGKNLFIENLCETYLNKTSNKISHTWFYLSLWK